MARIIQLLFTIIGLVFAITAPAQTRSKKPAAEKVIGTSLNEQKKWELRQLPLNSVLYRYQSPGTPIDPVEYGVKNVKLPLLNLPGVQPPVAAHQPNIYLQAYLKEQRQQYLPGKKNYWWSEAGIDRKNKLYQESKIN